jgi:hypothetical protein
VNDSLAAAVNRAHSDASPSPRNPTRAHERQATVVELSPAQLEHLADLLADRLRPPSTAQLVTATELAERLGVDPKTVYRHADDLGAIRVGRRLRFDPETALARYVSVRSQPAESRTETGKTRGRRSAANAGHCQLLPVGRRKGR